MGLDPVNPCEPSVSSAAQSVDPVSHVPATTPTGSTMTSSTDGSPHGTCLNVSSPPSTSTSTVPASVVIPSAIQQEQSLNQLQPPFSPVSPTPHNFQLSGETHVDRQLNGIAEGFTADSTSWMTVSTATVDSFVPEAFPPRKIPQPLPSAIANAAVVPSPKDRVLTQRNNPHLLRHLPDLSVSRKISQSTNNHNRSISNHADYRNKKKAAYNSPAPPSSLLSLTHPESTQVELRIEAYNLLNKDKLSLSDPFVVLYADHFGVGAEELGRTETVFDDLNPKFQTRFVFTYRASRSSNVILELYDRDSLSENSSLTRHDFLGRSEVDVATVLDELGGRVTVNLQPLEGKKNSRMDRGVVSIFAEILVDPERGYGVARRPRRTQSFQEPQRGCLIPQGNRANDDTFSLCSDLTEKSKVSQMYQVLEMRKCLQNSIIRPGIVVLRVNCAALKRKKSVSGLISSREVTQFFEVQRKRAEARGKSSWTTVYRSEDGRRINNNGYVEFKTAALSESAIHNGQPRRELRFVFYRRNIRCAHEMICYAQASLADLVSDRRTNSLTAVPLCGQYVDDEGLGAMQVVGITRDPKRDDTVVLDLSVDIFMPRGYCSSLMETRAKKKIIRGGMSGYVLKQVSLH